MWTGKLWVTSALVILQKSEFLTSLCISSYYMEINPNKQPYPTMTYLHFKDELFNKMKQSLWLPEPYRENNRAE